MRNHAFIRRNNTIYVEFAKQNRTLINKIIKLSWKIRVELGQSDQTAAMQILYRTQSKRINRCIRNV
jgi:hypothetical protein